MLRNLFCNLIRIQCPRLIFGYSGMELEIIYNNSLTIEFVLTRTGNEMFFFLLSVIFLLADQTKSLSRRKPVSRLPLTILLLVALKNQLVHSALQNNAFINVSQTSQQKRKKNISSSFPIKKFVPSKNDFKKFETENKFPLRYWN